MSAPSYLQVWEEDSAIKIHASCLQSIDAAVLQWRERGIDSVLNLETWAGEPVTLLASRITSWLLSTPEGRQREIEMEAELRAEVQHNRAAVGLPWEDE